ncbi:MAG: V-type ATP synthase subunit E [Candidatus Ranarchaeia archaeon]|jgi:V/A-type H+-transporting ATPase subunit E
MPKKEKSIDNVTSLIIKDAKKHAESRKETGVEEVKQTLENEYKRLLKDQKRILDRAKTQADQRIRAGVSGGRLGVKGAVLQTKEELIDEVLANSIRKLADFSKTPKYKKTLTNLIKSAVESLPAGNYIIELNKQDQNLSLSSVAVPKRTLKKGKAILNSAGGAIISTPDQSIVIDNTFESLLKSNKGELRRQIAKILF